TGRTSRADGRVGADHGDAPTDMEDEYAERPESRRDVPERIAVLEGHQRETRDEHHAAPQPSGEAEPDEPEERIDDEEEVARIGVWDHRSISRRARRSILPLAVNGRAGIRRTRRGSAYSGSQWASARRT